ncbi:hypothetical protein PGT21_008620 [Puccinia graminis f. sp. tritici]|uniref:Uncharacterized protein n=1 Tax=Puccinia graminis f. sp. tritici TaxID=56615 RepID=A0A5B0QMG1_PUCGR|nr:hypothetical protein PGT21_008620 [Puccinia graminis f. sp. tritici]
MTDRGTTLAAVDQETPYMILYRIHREAPALPHRATPLLYLPPPLFPHHEVMTPVFKIMNRLLTPPVVLVSTSYYTWLLSSPIEALNMQQMSNLSLWPELRNRNYISQLKATPVRNTAERHA